MRNALLLACAAALATPATAATVIVHVFNSDFSINPQGGAVVDAIVSLGDTVRWQFDSGLHSSTSVAGIAEVWDSSNMSTGGQFDHTFSNMGTFWYFCDIHGFDNGNGTAGGMSGTVTVVPEPASLLALGGLALLAAKHRRQDRKRW